MILRNVKFDFKVTKGKDYKRYIQGYKAAMVALNALDKEDDEYLIKFNEILDDFFADLLGDDYDQRLGIDVDDLEDLITPFLCKGGVARACHRGRRRSLHPAGL